MCAKFQVDRSTFQPATRLFGRKANTVPALYTGRASSSSGLRSCGPKKHKVPALPPRLRHLTAQARTLLLYFGLFLFAVEITTKSRGIVVRHPLQSSSTTSLKGRPQCQSTDKKVTSVAHHPPESSHSPLRRQKSNKPLLRGLVLAGRTKNERETSRGEKD